MRGESDIGIDALERLEAQIFELWGHISAATHRFLELVAEFDRAEGWAQYGCANCAQWLNLKCGIGSVAAREKVRVARALESLPAVSDAFRHGRISYSKVRAMTRVATPETEETLLNIALWGTASHVERLVRKYRRVERILEAERANERHRNRYLYFGYDDDDSLMIHAKLPPEVGAMVLKAIEAAVEATETEKNVSAETFSDDDDHDPVSARRADALAAMAEHFIGSERRARPSAADRYQVVVHIDQSLLSAGGTQGGCCEIDDGPTLAVETARRLACDSALVGIVENAEGEPLDIGRKTRAIPAAMQRALKARDGGCRFPGCDRTRYTEGHHIEHWADGGETKLSNLITLCYFHHRLLHEGGFGLRVTDDGAYVFSRPDGERISPTGTEKCFRGNISLLNRGRGIAVERPPGWHGERMDYGLAVESLL